MTSRSLLQRLALPALLLVSLTVMSLAVTDTAEAKEDRNRNFYLDLGAGYSYANLVQLSEDNFVPDAELLQGSGINLSGGLGVRIYMFTIGGRATFSRHGDFDVGMVELDLSVRIPLKIIEPFLRLGIGYAWLGRGDISSGSRSFDTQVNGLAVDAGIGVDVRILPMLWIGAGVDAVFLNLTRQKISDAGSIASVDLEEDGDSVGFQLRGAVRMTLRL